MLIKIMAAECDICGRTDKAVRTSGQYNEDEYRLPDGWAVSKVNGTFCFCPACAAALEKRRTRGDETVGIESVTMRE